MRRACDDAGCGLRRRTSTVGVERGYVWHLSRWLDRPGGRAWRLLVRSRLELTHDLTYVFRSVPRSGRRMQPVPRGRVLISQPCRPSISSSGRAAGM